MMTTVYTGRQSVLNETLGEYQGKGFRLMEYGDHVLLLYYQDRRIAVFSQEGATVLEIRRACALYLACAW